VKSINMSSTQEGWMGDPKKRQRRNVIQRASGSGIVGANFTPTIFHTSFNRMQSSGTTL